MAREPARIYDPVTRARTAGQIECYQAKTQSRSAPDMAADGRFIHKEIGDSDGGRLREQAVDLLSWSTWHSLFPKQQLSTASSNRRNAL